MIFRNFNKENFDKMILSFDDAKFDVIMTHIGRLGNVGVVFAGSIGLMKYASNITTCCPYVSFIIGVIGLILTFWLLVWIGFGGWKALYNSSSNRVIGHVAGTFFFIFSVSLGLGGIFVAVNA